jgi:hypothetical protein
MHHYNVSTVLGEIKLEDCPTLDELSQTLEDRATKEARLMRNRASAKLSRERQKEKIRYLTERCQLLEKRNKELALDNMVLYADNVAMHKNMVFNKNANRKV